MVSFIVDKYSDLELTKRVSRKMFSNAAKMRGEYKFLSAHGQGVITGRRISSRTSMLVETLMYIRLTIIHKNGRESYTMRDNACYEPEKETEKEPEEEYEEEEDEEEETINYDNITLGQVKGFLRYVFLSCVEVKN